MSFGFSLLDSLLCHATVCARHIEINGYLLTYLLLVDLQAKAGATSTE